MSETSTNDSASPHVGEWNFKPGNKLGQGNPHAKAVAMVKAAIHSALTPEKADRIARKLVNMAEGGDLDAMRELFNRIMGKSHQSLEISGEIEHTITALVSAANNGGFARGTRLRELMAGQKPEGAN